MLQLAAADEMIDPASGEPHPRHTAYPMPFLILGMRKAQLSTGCGLADVAPTVLDLLGLAQPAEMIGRNLLLKITPAMARG